MVRAAQEAKTRLRQKLEIVYEQRCSIVRSTSQVLQLWSYWDPVTGFPEESSKPKKGQAKCTFETLRHSQRRWRDGARRELEGTWKCNFECLQWRRREKKDGCTVIGSKFTLVAAEASRLDCASGGSTGAVSLLPCAPTRTNRTVVGIATRQACFSLIPACR